MNKTKQKNVCCNYVHSFIYLFFFTSCAIVNGGLKVCVGKEEGKAVLDNILSSPIDVCEDKGTVNEGEGPIVVFLCKKN